MDESSGDDNARAKIFGRPVTIRVGKKSNVGREVIGEKRRTRIRPVGD